MKRAFTLAEVLITLGVIGVIAAITIPSVIKHYQKQAWTNQLKKSYSTLCQALEKMKADEGVIDFVDTELAKVNDLEEYNILGKYLKTIKIEKLYNYKYSYLNSNEEFVDISNQYGLFLTDGTIIFNLDKYIRNDDNFNGLVASFYIDINGLKAPNKIGRDIFKFMLYYNKFLPVGTKTLSALLAEKYETGNANTREWENGTRIYNCRTDKESQGMGCGARILEKGKMDY